jgi:hypothetical protein
VDNEIVELPPHLSTRMWDSFKTYMLYPFMIAVAGSFGLSIGTHPPDPRNNYLHKNSILIFIFPCLGYALYDRAAAASTNISFNFINLSALKQRLRWK